MNRRRFLIALAVLVPLALFGFARSAASWRPIAVGAMRKDISPGFAYSQPYVSATSREVCVHMAKFIPTVFDLSSNDSSSFFGAVTREQNALWELERATPRQKLKLHFAPQSEAPQMRTFYLPDHSSAVMSADVQVSSGADSVQMIAGMGYYRWDKKSGALQKEFRIIKTPLRHGFGQIFLSSDDQTIIAAATRGPISRVSTQTELFSQRFALDGLKSRHYYPQQFSAGGNYLWYREVREPDMSQDQFTMVDTTTASVLYRFEHDQNDLTLFSPDETLFAIGRAATSHWELRDAHSGALVRTLALVPGAKVAALSPDGATLYSVASGVLYRQRAR